MSPTPYDPDELRQRIEVEAADPGTQAEIDQRRAALDQERDQLIWWASLASLSRVRGNPVAHLVAMDHVKGFLAELDVDGMFNLFAYLAVNTVHLAAALEHRGDIAEAVSRIIGPQNMLNFELFCATSGASCPMCGHSDGWSEHKCGDEDESQ